MAIFVLFFAFLGADAQLWVVDLAFFFFFLFSVFKGFLDRLPEVTQKPFLGPDSLSLQCWHWENSKVLAAWAFCEMLSQYPQSASQGCSGGVAGKGQQEFATQTLRVHLLGIDYSLKKGALGTIFRDYWQPFQGSRH